MRLLPEAIREKVAKLPEYRMGPHNVAVVLRDGRVVQDVIVVWEEEVIGEGGGTEISFAPEDVIDVLDRS